MGKNRIKSLRTINVDGIEYKWLFDDYGWLKIWKDKKIVYEDGFNKGYSQVSYNLVDDQMTPEVVAKVIRLVNYTEHLIPNEDVLDAIRISEGLNPNHYKRHASYEDKTTEKLMAKFMDSFAELKQHLEHKEIFENIRKMVE